MIVWIGRSIRGKGCALRVLPSGYYHSERLRSATYVQRHLHDDDDKDDEDYPLFYGRTSPRTSLFQECELLWKRSLSRYRLLERSRGILRFLFREERASYSRRVEYNKKNEGKIAIENYDVTWRNFELLAAGKNALIHDLQPEQASNSLDLLCINIMKVAIAIIIITSTVL